jgi:hypothetical protein
MFEAVGFCVFRAAAALLGLVVVIVRPGADLLFV